ncbi:MAG: hypothetical protein Kow0090_04280 [Myxococcota bacterium]
MTGPESYRYFLTIPSLVIFVGMIVHSVRYRGKAVSFWFFLLSFLYFLGRELFVATFPLFSDRYGGVPEYWHPYALGKVLGVPLPVVFGWIMVAYLAWFFGEKIAEKDPLLKGRLFAIVWFAMLSCSVMALAVEATGVHLGWWVWAQGDTKDFDHPFREFLHRAPFASLRGWMMTVSTFLIPFFLIGGRGLYHWGKKRWALLLIIPLHTILIYGFDYPGWVRRAIIWGTITILALFLPLKLKLGKERDISSNLPLSS